MPSTSNAGLWASVAAAPPVAPDELESKYVKSEKMNKVQNVDIPIKKLSMNESRSRSSNSQGQITPYNEDLGHSSGLNSEETARAVGGEGKRAPVAIETAEEERNAKEQSHRAKIYSLVIDSGPIINNTISQWKDQCRQIITTPIVLAEIKDANSRKMASFYWPQFFNDGTEYAESLLGNTKFITRLPKAESVRFIRDFARKTGDLTVISITDIQVLALCYEEECLLNHGDWRIKNDPKQKGTNGSPPVLRQQYQNTPDNVNIQAESSSNGSVQEEQEIQDEQGKEEEKRNDSSVASKSSADEQPASESDDEGWVTPKNFSQMSSSTKNRTARKKAVFMKAAMTSTDFAMQNVALQIGLNLVSTKSLQEITSVKSWVLRCHGCFQICRNMEKKFCPSCGNPTLLRTSVSTDSKGELQVHLKKKMFWRTRGNVYPLSKPRPGSANQKGVQNIILAEDQNEHLKLLKAQRRAKDKPIDLDDPDWLPGLITGQRKTKPRIQIGAGRDPNAVRRNNGNR